MTEALTLDPVLEPLIKEVVNRLANEMVRRGFVVRERMPAPAAQGDYDDAACRAFADRHIGDDVLSRAALFFGELERNGEISSTDLVTALKLKGATSIAANLTNSLKKRARRLGLAEPWAEGANADDRTVWKDRDGIAARMVVAIEQERTRRGLLP